MLIRYCWCCYKVRRREVYIRTLGKWGKTPWARLIPAPPGSPNYNVTMLATYTFVPSQVRSEREEFWSIILLR